jgi:hypothetical protein
MNMTEDPREPYKASEYVDELLERADEKRDAA